MKGLTEIREYFEILKNMCVCLSLCEPFNSSLYKNGSCILAKKIKVMSAFLTVHLIHPILGTWKKSKASVLNPSQWTFWYCNYVEVRSPSISPWHWWYIVNETHDDVNLRYQTDIRILRLDQSDFNVVITSSW